VFGPLETPDDHGPALGELTASSVNRMCATVAERLNARLWKPMPTNMIPAWLEVDGIRVNAAQFLKLMFESLVAPSAKGAIKVRMTNMLSPAGLIYPKMRMSIDQGGTWTFRPAALSLGPSVLKSQR
jgi:hypothetical protein